MLNKLKRNFLSKTFVNYGLIGMTGVTLDFLIYLLLVKIGFHPIYASAISVSIAITNNFILNAVFNFKTKDQLLRRFVNFYGVGCIGILVTSIILFIGHDILGAGAVTVKVISIPFVVGMQFLLNKKISFSQDTSVKKRGLAFAKRISIKMSLFFAEKAFLIVVAGTLFFLTLISVMFTIDNWWEVTTINSLYSILILLIACLTLFGVLIVLSSWLGNKRARPWVTLKIVIGAQLVFGFLYICLIEGRVIHAADPAILLDSTNQARLTAYLQAFPHQISYTLLIRLSEWLFGQGCLLFLYILNLASLIAVTVSVSKLTHYIFRSSITTVIANLIMGISSLYMLYYIPFIYGDLIGLGFLLVGLWLLLSCGQELKLRMVFAAILFIAAILVKSSLMIPAVVALAIWTYQCIGISKFRRVLLGGSVIAVITLGVSGLQSFAISMYEVKYHVKISKEYVVPKIAWVAMGLQSGPVNNADIYYSTRAKSIQSIQGAPAPGAWQYFVNNVRDKNRTTEEMGKISTQYVKKSISEFANNPGYTLSFFAYKSAYQWADPTYETRTYISSNGDEIGVGRWMTMKVSEASKVLITVNDSNSYFRQAITWLGDVLQTILYLSAGWGVLFVVKRLRDNRSAFSLAFTLAAIFMSGFLMYLLWEVAPRYSIPFVVIIIPLAAYGIHNFMLYSHKTIVRFLIPRG